MVFFFNYLYPLLSKNTALTSTQILPYFFFPVTKTKMCVKLETFLKQSKFAANSIHKFITTFPLLISLFIVLFIFVITTLSFAGLRASRFASGHSHTARVLCCGPRSSGSPVRTALRRAALCSAALAQAAPGLQLQNRPEASAPFSMPPPPPSQRRAIDPSRDIPDRCQQMVLWVQPSSRHALPGTRLPYTSATQPFVIHPHAWNLGLADSMVPHHVRMFTFSLLTLPLLGCHDMAWPCLFWTMLGF